MSAAQGPLLSHNGAAMNDGFSGWIPFDVAGLQRAPDAPAAVQLGRADRTLVLYPSGKSAMVFYFYAARSAREALARVFKDELEEPGARGQGPLVYRVLEGGDDARVHLERLFDDFRTRFGRAPILHPDDEDPDGA